jgi:tetratricopeptide (TPR) repeat protein
MGVLREVRQRAKDSAFASNVEQVLGLALIRRGQVEEALRMFQALHKQFPASETGFTAVGRALMAAGKVEEALEFSRTVEATSPLYTEALRMRARVAEAQGKYADLTATYRELSAARNIAASDWNDMAWGMLFASGAAEPNLEWAQKAVQLSQGRSLPMLQTLASVQAELGKLKEARESILRYIGDREPIDPGTFYVMGRIAEQLGFADEAIGIYSRIPKPERTNGVGLHDLAKIRIAAAQGNSK